MKRPLVVGLLSASASIQVLGLSVETQRLHLARPFYPGYMFDAPMLYFHPAASHLFQRPREIWEIAHLDELSIEGFTPAARPLWPVVDDEGFSERNMLVYRVLNSWRPWWISLRYLPAGQRPLDLGAAAFVLSLLAAAGLMVLLRYATTTSEPGTP